MFFNQENIRNFVDLKKHKTQKYDQKQRKLDIYFPFKR